MQVLYGHFSKIKRERAERGGGREREERRGEREGDKEREGGRERERGRDGGLEREREGERERKGDEERYESEREEDIVRGRERWPNSGITTPRQHKFSFLNPRCSRIKSKAEDSTPTREKFIIHLLDYVGIMNIFMEELAAWHTCVNIYSQTRASLLSSIDLNTKLLGIGKGSGGGCTKST